MEVSLQDRPVLLIFPEAAYKESPLSEKPRVLDESSILDSSAAHYDLFSSPTMPSTQIFWQEEEICQLDGEESDS